VIQSQAWNPAFFSFWIDVAPSISLKDGQNSSRMLSWQRQTGNHSSICILDRIRSRLPSHQVNHHLVFQKKKLFLTCEFKKVTSFLSMSILSTLSAIHWPRPSPLLPHSNTTFEFRVGSLGGPSPSTEDQKKRFSLLGIDFWLFRSLLVQLSSSSICLPISSQVRMCVGGRGRRSCKDTFLKRVFLVRKPTEWVNRCTSWSFQFCVW